MKEIEIRKSADERRIFKVVRKIFPKASPSFSEKDVYFIAKTHGKDVGCLHLILRNGKVLLQGVGVLKSQREKGIGGKLVDKAIRYADKLGMDILLKVKPLNCPAINLYVKKGFTLRKIKGDMYILHRKICS